MKRRYLPLVSLFFIAPLLASCLSNDDEETIVYNDAAITSFSIKTLKRVVHTTSKSGADSSYVVNFPASDYHFYINQLTREIYNPDSLPLGIDASKVLATITTKNAGVLGVKNVANDSVKFYKATDSLDFVQPRQIVVYNQAGTALATYKIHVNVHREASDVFKWSQPVKQQSTLGALTGMRVLVNNGRLYVFGTEGEHAKLYTATTKSGADWHELSTNVALSAQAWQNVALMGQTFYVYNNGVLLSSADAQNWQKVADVALKHLVGATENKLYALSSEGQLVVSSDQGKSWTREKLDGQEGQLPQKDFSLLVLPVNTNRGVNRLFLAGTTDKNNCLWSKIDDADPNAEQQPWTFFSQRSTDRYALPNMYHLQVGKNGDALIAMGGAGMGESSAVKPFAQFYRSIDGGLSWHQYGNLTFPKDFQSSATSFAMASDENHYLWLICGKTGQVWKGRFNELGWKKVQTSFTE